MRRIANQKLNEYLKELGKQAGIDAPTARTRYWGGQRLLAHWQRQGKVLWYTDECRFSRQAPVSHAWQKRGQRAQGSGE